MGAQGSIQETYIGIWECIYSMYHWELIESCWYSKDIEELVRVKNGDCITVFSFLVRSSVENNGCVSSCPNAQKSFGNWQILQGMF